MRIIVGVTGTTGVEMSYELLLALRRAGCEVHLIISRGAQMTWDYESRMPLQRMYDLANFVYQEDELDAVISSGSFVTDGMILMPCSMKTLAGIVAGILLAMVSVALSRVPTLTAVLLAALSVAAAFVQPGVLLLAAAAIALLLLTWQKSKNAVSAASFLLVGVIVAGIAAISLQTGTMQSLSENAKNALHYWRYEKAGEVLPEGNLSEPVTKTESTDTILSVTADTAQTLYLRGFVGDTYENETWTALDTETAAEEKDLFY